MIRIQKEKNITFGPADQQATIHPKNTHEKKKDTKMKKKRKNGGINASIRLKRNQ